MVVLTCLLLLAGPVLARQKPVVVVLTDIGGDTDDEQSMVRCLLYADVLDIRALCATSRMQHGMDTRPDIIRRQIAAYAQVYPSLVRHSPGYPPAAALEAAVAAGLGDARPLGKGYDTEASRRIISVVDSARTTVHILAWGGQRELAQALWSVQHTRSSEALRQFCAKIQVHAIGDQDGHGAWILQHFKGLRYIGYGLLAHGDRRHAAYRGMYMTGDSSLQHGNWVRQSVYGHGPLADLYPLNGHGTDGMKEGDSPSFLGLIPNGLNEPGRPEWGGWGGRYRILHDKVYADAGDTLDGVVNERFSVSRWRLDFQRDFMARLDWCVKPYEKANHRPALVVNGQGGPAPLVLSAKGGERLVFRTRGSHDPDRDRLHVRWMIYRDISDPHAPAPELSREGKVCRLRIPQALQDTAVQLIAELRDEGSPTLVTYKRIVIHVSPAQTSKDYTHAQNPHETSPLGQAEKHAAGRMAGYRLLAGASPGF